MPHKRPTTITIFSILLTLASASVALSQIRPAAESTSSDNTSQLLAAALERTHQLLDRENAKDFDSVKQFVWDSPSALFVAKTATVAEGNWAGFWGHDVVVQHLHDVIFGGPFRIDPDYTKEIAVLLSPDVAETYVPVKITVGYGGQQAVPKPFLLLMDWVRVKGEWKMASDIAIPVPEVPSGHQ
jgi:predicted AlkP superfamily pyrophosphatase or phosphodiesterase